MSDWKTQNEAIWAQVDFVYSDPETTSLAWITCDSFRHVQTLLATFRAHFPDAQHLEHRIVDFKGSNFTQYFQNKLPEEFMRPSSNAKFLHVMGLESHVGIGLAQPSSGLFDALNLEREIMFLRFPFNIVFWTDSYSQIKAQTLAPDFWDWLTDKFHFEAPEDIAKAELEWMREEKEYVQPEKRAELYHQISQQIGKLDSYEGHERLSLLEAIADNFQALQEYDKAAYYREEVLNMLDLLLPQQVAWHLGELGRAYQVLGHWAEAEKAYQEGLRICQEIGNRAGEGRTLNNLSQIYKAQGDYPKALDYLERSLPILQEISDREGEGVTLSNLSQIYDAQGDYPKARDYLERSLRICQEVGDRAGEGTTLNNLSQIYDAQGDYPKALDYLERSLRIRQEIGDRRGEGGTLNNLSQIYDAQGDYAKALDYLERSLRIRQEIGDRAGGGVTLHNLGGMALELGKLEQAVPYLVKAAAILNQLGSPDAQSPNRFLARIQQKLGEETYQAILAKLPKDEDPFDLSSLPQLQID
jgi:tetratricopeptide (TPR) repeat protein